MTHIKILFMIFTWSILTGCAPFTESPILSIETGMHTAAVTSIDVDREEKFIVTSSLDKTIRIWSFATGELINTLRVPSGKGLDGQIYSCAISPNNMLIAAAGRTGKEFGQKTIYIFDRKSAQLVKRLGFSTREARHLAFSPDGKYLVSTFAGKQGIRVWETVQWRMIFKDTSYGASCNWADFDGKGRLVTLSDDGKIRLYDSSFALQDFIRAPGGKRPYSASFSPDGKLLAVGFRDTVNIDILSSENLLHLYSPDTSKILNGRAYVANTSTTMDGSMGVLCWSLDGNRLYFGGIPSEELLHVHSWSNKGRGKWQNIAIPATNAIADLTPVSEGFLYSSYDASFGLVRSNNTLKITRKAAIIDSRKNLRKFLVSKDGSTIQFFPAIKSKNAVQFSLHNHVLTEITDTKNIIKLEPPRLKSSSFGISGWEANLTPKFNIDFIPLEKGEVSQSLSIHPKDQGFILGTTSHLRCYDAAGGLKWFKQTPTNWAVNVSGNGQIIVAASSDGSIRWYQWENGDEIAALYVDGNTNRWVIWTPDGFFDHSPGGESMIGYNINRGADTAPIFVSVDQMYDHFYRPDVIFSRFIGEKQIPTEDFSLGPLVNQELPPKVKLLVSEKTTEGAAITFKVNLLNQGGGFGRVVYRVNDATHETLDNVAAPVRGQSDVIEIQKELPLSTGENIIQVTAFNKSNSVESKPAMLKIVRKTHELKKPKLYIIAIGINKYQDHALELAYSVDDAKGLIDTITKRGESLFEDIEIDQLFDNAATKENISKTFLDVAKRISSDDVFLLYMAGHGLNVEGNYYFFPWELIYTGDDSVQQGALNREEIQFFLSKIKANKAVVLLDTCDAGAFSDSKKRGLVAKTAIYKLVRATGRATIMAASDDQAALEGYNGHGVFTWALIEAINGAADIHGDNNKETAINEVAEFVMEKVPEITLEKWQYRQFPMHNLYGVSFPLGIVDSEPEKRISN